MEEEKIIYMVHGDGVVPVRTSEIVSLVIPEIDPSVVDPAPEYAYLVLKSRDGKYYGQYPGGGINSVETVDACFRPKVDILPMAKARGLLLTEKK